DSERIMTLFERLTKEMFTLHVGNMTVVVDRIDRTGHQIASVFVDGDQETMHPAMIVWPGQRNPGVMVPHLYCNKDDHRRYEDWHMHQLDETSIEQLTTWNA